MTRHEQMPERAHLDADAASLLAEKIPGDTAYVRADLYDAQAARIAALEAKVARYEAAIAAVSNAQCLWDARQDSAALKTLEKALDDLAATQDDASHAPP